MNMNFPNQNLAGAGASLSLPATQVSRRAIPYTKTSKGVTTSHVAIPPEAQTATQTPAEQLAQFLAELKTKPASQLVNLPDVQSPAPTDTQPATHFSAQIPAPLGLQDPAPLTIQDLTPPTAQAPTHDLALDPANLGATLADILDKVSALSEQVKGSGERRGKRCLLTDGQIAAILEHRMMNETVLEFCVKQGISREQYRRVTERDFVNIEDLRRIEEIYNGMLVDV
jgi:hypothetical protein